MLHANEIRDILRGNMKRDKMYHLQEIYKIFEENCILDDEDYLPQSPSSSLPKWKRNVRNVLQSDKNKGWILYDGKANYILI